MNRQLVDQVRGAYRGGDGPALTLGAPVHDAEIFPEPLVALPLGMLNRHGLIAGATGTGKTKTLQLLAEQLSFAGVPVFLADLKGDLGGLAVPGQGDLRIAERARHTGYRWVPAACPVEFLSLTGRRGAALRATPSSFGPLALSKVLDLNETQASVLAMVFKYCDDRGLLLLDLSDLRAVLLHLSGDGASDLQSYGGMSKASVGVLLRRLVELEQMGATPMFGEPEFEVEDLLRHASDGRGIVSVLGLADVQDKPVLWSTFMMWLLAQLYHALPEVGDLPKPKLVFFFDEAHLLFKDASKAFLAQIEQVVRLIRSKGVGVFFVTQNPRDIPPSVLGQLGNRVQHALRAFTPDDEKAMKAAARTFPKTAFYDVPATLTTLGIGEALVTVLAETGAPTPPVVTHLAPPSSRMGPLHEDEWAPLLDTEQVRHYARPIDRESARERLGGRRGPAQESPSRERSSASAGRRGRRTDGVDTDAYGQPAGQDGVERPGDDASPWGELLQSPFGKTVGRELVRGLMGALLGPGARARRRRRPSLF